jgi:hypothetical protein
MDSMGHLARENAGGTNLDSLLFYVGYVMARCHGTIVYDLVGSGLCAGWQHKLPLLHALMRHVEV